MRYMHIIEREVQLRKDSQENFVDEFSSMIEYFSEKYDVLLNHIFINPPEPYEEVWDVIDDDYNMHYKAIIAKFNKNKDIDISVVEMVKD